MKAKTIYIMGDVGAVLILIGVISALITYFTGVEENGEWIPLLQHLDINIVLTIILLMIVGFIFFFFSFNLEEAGYGE